MLSKEEIVRTIENDNDFSKCGDYYAAFINNEMNMCREYDYAPEVEEANASPEKEVSWDCRMTTTTIKVMADDGHRLLIKETLSDWNGSCIQFWVLNKSSLLGDPVWILNDR